jgi:hypothetical protein
MRPPALKNSTLINPSLLPPACEVRILPLRKPRPRRETSTQLKEANPVLGVRLIHSAAWLSSFFAAE